MCVCVSTRWSSPAAVSTPLVRRGWLNSGGAVPPVWVRHAVVVWVVIPVVSSTCIFSQVFWWFSVPLCLAVESLWFIPPESGGALSWFGSSPLCLVKLSILFRLCDYFVLINTHYLVTQFISALLSLSLKCSFFGSHPVIPWFHQQEVTSSNQVS